MSEKHKSIALRRGYGTDVVLYFGITSDVPMIPNWLIFFDNLVYDSRRVIMLYLIEPAVFQACFSA